MRHEDVQVSQDRGQTRINADVLAVTQRGFLLLRQSRKASKGQQTDKEVTKAVMSPVAITTAGVRVIAGGVKLEPTALTPLAEANNGQPKAKPHSEAHVQVGKG